MLGFLTGARSAYDKTDALTFKPPFLTLSYGFLKQNTDTVFMRWLKESFTVAQHPAFE